MLLCKLKYSMVQKKRSLRMRIRRIISKLSLVLLLEMLMVKVCFSNGDQNVFKDHCDIRRKEHCFFVASYGIRFDWKDAHIKCQDKNSSLPIIRNREEQTALETYLRLLKSKYPNSTGIDAVWTSGKKKAIKGWNWIDNDQPLDQQISGINDSADKTHAVIDWSDRGNIIKPENPVNNAWYLCQHKDRQCNGQYEVNATNGCLIPSEYGNASWYEAKDECLLTHGDLAVFTDQDQEILKKHKFPNPTYWIGLRKEYWVWKVDRGSQASEVEVKYTKWKREQMPTDDDLCIFIDTSNGQWRATFCSEKASVVCEKRATSKTDAEHGIAISTTTAAGNSLTTASTNAANNNNVSQITGAIAAGVAIVIGILVVVIILCRKSRSSKNKTEPAAIDLETKDRKTKENPSTTTTTTTTTTTAEERSIYADIALTVKTTTDDNTVEANKKGTVYASLDFDQGGVTYAEPSKLYTNTQKNVSSPIYAEPLNGGTGIQKVTTSAGSSPAVKVGPMGDVYALPTNSVTPSSSDKTTERAIYANT